MRRLFDCFAKRTTASVLALAWLAARTGVAAGAPAYLPDWSSVPYAFSPLDPAAVAQPVITPQDVTGGFVYFVADPFLVHEDGTWYLFFEATFPLGRICLATSLDGLHWQYQQVVLKEGFHVSFPHVFQYDGVYYMTPESTARHSVRLYHAIRFPERWEYEQDLVIGRNFADPTVFPYRDRWWMFVGNAASDSCFLYSSEQLQHGWIEHPASPIVAGDRGTARPAGRVIVLSDERVYRLAQDCTPNYGHAVRVFQIDELTTTGFREHEIATSPLLQASGSGWNADAMHHCDPWWDGDHWLAAVDGAAEGAWRIGIYRGPSVVPSEAGAGWKDTAPRLQCSPNPFRGATRILAWPDLQGSGRLRIYDASGRMSRVVPLSNAARTAFLWDGTDDHGRRVPPGVYFCMLDLGFREATTRVVLVK